MKRLVVCEGKNSPAQKLKSVVVDGDQARLVETGWPAETDWTSGLK